MIARSEAPLLRDYRSTDADGLREVALAAFEHFRFLHTTPIMTVALPLYLRMGFVRLRDAPAIHGVPYAIYTKALTPA